MDWSGEWWLAFLFAGLALLIRVRIYSSRSRETALKAISARLGLSSFNGPKPFSTEELRGSICFPGGSDQTTMASDLWKKRGWLLVYRHNVVCAPQALPSFWQASRQIADLFLNLQGERQTQATDGREL